MNMNGNDLQLQQYFHFFTDGREEPHFLTGMDGELCAANPAACRMLGRCEDDLRHEHLAAMVDSPESIPKCLRNWARMTTPLPEPLTWVGESGARFPTFAHGSILQLDASAPRYLLIYTTPEISAAARSVAATRAMEKIYSYRNEVTPPTRQRRETGEQRQNDQNEMIREAKTDEERLEALWRLNQVEFKSEKDFIDQALEEAVMLTASEGGYLHLFKEDQSTVDHFSWSSKVNAKCSAKRVAHQPLSNAGIWADSARKRQPVIHNDFQQESAKKGLPEGHFPLKRHMSVPVVDESRIVALAGVGNKKNPYDQTDVRQLSLFVNNLWRILKQKRTELEVLKAKEEWESTFDAIDEVITVHDQEMRIMRANKATGRLFNVDPAELVGRYCYEVVRNISEPCPGCPELLSRADLQPHQAIIRHDNLKKTFHVSSSPVIDENGVVKGFIHLAKDVTRQRILENKLQQTQKMEAIGVLAGGIAHDFNNILAPIIGYTDLALNHLQPTNSVATYLQQVNKAANRARELVQQILTFGRQAVQEKKPLQLHLVINEALKLLRATLPTTIEIHQHIPDCGAVLADPIQIHQIVMNLATNAAHAMRETGGVLEINLRRIDIDQDHPLVASLELMPGSYVMFEVSDTGHGMSREILDRVFEPYFSTKQTGEGTGLGLAVVHGIVESYGGHITATSEPGEGTLFQIYLPRMKGEFHEGESFLKKPLPRGSERILIVDDEEVIVPMLREMLEGLGYLTTISNDSIDTWELFKKNPDAFDLLITDMAMPGITGFDLAKKVLALRPRMPIILCTGFSEVIDREKARAAGIGAFLVKPVTMRELAETVRRVLD